MSIDEQPMNVYWSGKRTETSNNFKTNYKGSVTTKNNLPSLGNKIGDMYNVVESGENFIWNGNFWDNLSGDILKTLNWQKSEKASAVVVYPVSGTFIELTASFMFTETDPEEGDKSSENPSTITGVASVNAYHANSNMLSYPYRDGNKTAYGIEAQMKKDGSVVFSGLYSEGNLYYNMDMAFPVKTGTVFYNTSKYKNRSNTSGVLRIFNDALGIGKSGVGSGGVMGAGEQWTADGTGAARATVRINKNQQVTNLTVFPSLSLFAYSGEYEFPETKKYSVVFEDTYYGGEVDFTKGTIAITHVKVEPDSLSVDISNAPADTVNFEYTDTFGRTIITTGDTLEISGGVSGGIVVYKLKNPIVKTIEKIKLQALPVLDKYSPRANTFFTDADSVVVGFAKHPARTEYELEQAIIASEGGE